MISTLNAVAFVATVALNGFASAPREGSPSVGDISHRNPTKFTPADFTFAIWAVIYSFLLSFVLYGFYDSTYAEQAGYLFAVSCIFNSAWIILWTREKYLAAQGLIMGLLVSLIAIYLKMDVRYGEHNTKPILATIAVNVTFSMYMAWLSVANIANTSITIARFIQPNRTDNTELTFLGIKDKQWSFIMQGVAVALATTILLVRNDFVFPMVVAWALFGIFKKNKN
jgi:tryptophan-rich sensory protein